MSEKRPPVVSAVALNSITLPAGLESTAFACRQDARHGRPGDGDPSSGPATVPTPS